MKLPVKELGEFKKMWATSMPFRTLLFERLHLRDPQLVESSSDLRCMRREVVSMSSQGRWMPKDDVTVEEGMALYMEVLNGDVVL